MTPKEKAQQLVEKFSLVGLQQRQEGIACALIAVDEILLVIDGLFTEQAEQANRYEAFTYLAAYLDNLDEKEYWQEVKTEIEHL